jgi:hypothetical protein
MLPVVGIVHCSCCWCLGCNAFKCLVVRHRGSIYWPSRLLCRDGVCFHLSCRHGHVCFRWVVISICCFTNVSPSCSYASVWSHSCLLPDLRDCVHRQDLWFNYLSSLPSCLNIKKKILFSSLVVVTMGSSHILHLFNFDIFKNICHSDIIHEQIKLRCVKLYINSRFRYYIHCRKYIQNIEIQIPIVAIRHSHFHNQN